MSHADTNNRFVVGKRMPRFDVREKILGSERYAGDLYVANMLTGYAIHSPVPHALLKNVDVEAARSLPGVEAVLTASDISGNNIASPYVVDEQPFMAFDRIRSVGDVICLIAAQDEETARKAGALIDIEYEPLPVIETPEEAMKSNAVAIHPGGNIAKHVRIRHGDAEEGFARADVIIEDTYTTQVIEHAYLEPDAALAYSDDDGILTVKVGSQGINDEQHNIANGLGLPMDQIRVVQPPMGGAFGGKEETTIGFYTALLAYHTGLPVKMVWSRRQVATMSNKRHPSIVHMKTGASRDGKLRAMQAEIIMDTGAYAHWGPSVMTFASCLSSGPYEIPDVWVDGYAVYTNNLRAGSMRGWGIPQLGFAWETQMDRLAEALDLHPLVFRWKNAVREGSMAITGESLPAGVGMRDTIRLAAEIRGISLPD